MTPASLRICVIEKTAKAAAFNYAALRARLLRTSEANLLANEYEALAALCREEAERAEDAIANTCQPR